MKRVTAPSEMKVLLNSKVHNVIKYIMHDSSYHKKERQFFFRIDMSDKDYYKIIDYYMIEQYNSWSTTRSTDAFKEDLVAWLMQNDREDEFNERCWWYHSHNTMSTFRSNQDRETMDDHTEWSDIFFSMVSWLSWKKNDWSSLIDWIYYRLSINLWSKYNITVDDVKVELYSDDDRSNFISQMNTLEDQKYDELLEARKSCKMQSPDLSWILKWFNLDIDVYDEELYDEIKLTIKKKYSDLTDDLIKSNKDLERFIWRVALESLIEAEKSWKIRYAKSKQSKKLPYHNPLHFSDKSYRHHYDYDYYDEEENISLLTPKKRKKIKVNNCESCSKSVNKNRNMYNYEYAKKDFFVCKECAKNLYPSYFIFNKNH